VTVGPAASDEVRRHNTSLVLRLLRDGGPTSRADLARGSGLAKATIGGIVAHLQEVGAVDEHTGPASTAPSTGRGRPSTPVALSGASLAGIGVEVNVDYLTLTALDLAGRELAFHTHAVLGPSPTLAEVEALVARGVGELAARATTVLGLTVAVPGLIDRGRGTVVHAPNLGWRDLDLVAVLQPLLPGVPVAVDNDANCAARAETLRGVAAGMGDVVYLTGTVGLGAGIVSGGEVLRGSRGLAGEVGHLPIGDDRHRCACGRTGCWEALVGQRAVVAATGVEVSPGEDPVAYAARVLADPGTHDALAPVVAAMARGVTQLVTTLDPSAVVLGGSFVPWGDLLVPALQEAVDRAFTGRGAEVLLSSLGLHAASVGAAFDALDDVFAGRRRLPVTAVSAEG
jgi:predicted NBD/HSP70 family sugar kinase